MVLNRNGVIKQRWLPGGHLGYPIMTENNRDLPLHWSMMPHKFDADRTTRSGVIVRNVKIKMAAWRPSWISDQTKNWREPSPTVVDHTIEISGQSDERFSFIKGLALHNKDGCLAAILDIVAAPKSNQIVPHIGR